MAIRSAGLTASLALAANAFMIPSTVSLPDVSLEGLDPALAVHADSAKIVKLPCPGCSFAGVDNKESAHAENSMVLTWSLGDDKKSLRLNGGEFYNGQLMTGLRSFPTSQVPSATTIEDIRDHFGEVATEPRDLFYHVLERFTPAADGTDAQLIDIDFSVNSLGNEQVNGADTITLRVLKDEQGRLVISDVVQVPADNTKPAHDVEAQPEEEKTFSILPVGQTGPPTVPMADKIKCEGRMRHACQFKAMLQHQMDMVRSAMQATGHRIRIIFIGKPHHHHGMHGMPGGMQHGGGHRRPCPGAQRHGPPGVNLKGGLPKFWRLGGAAAGLNQEQGMPQGPPQGSHAGHGHRRMRCHRFLNVLRRVFFGFIVPVLIGVAAGMTASLLGMVVGTLLAMFWIKCVRGGRRGSASLQIDAAREEALVDELEKTGLMEDEQRDSEELPAYEDQPAPAYEDKEVRQ